MKNNNLSEKLILYFLLLGLGTIFLISIYSYYSTQEALMNRTFDQLTSLRVAKKNQVEIFFRDRIKGAVHQCFLGTVIGIDTDNKNGA